MIAALKKVGQQWWREFRYWQQLNQGLQRLRRGYCPLCNSDAPELDTCPVCDGHRHYFALKGVKRRDMAATLLTRYHQHLNTQQGTTP